MIITLAMLFPIFLIYTTIEQSYMALLEILEFPDPRLRTKAKPVTTFDTNLAQLADDMLETMYAAPGVGLAATQINVHERLLVIDVSEDKSQPLVFVNPEISTITSETISHQEGCLSVPDFFEDVIRPEKVLVKAVDVSGKPFELECEGLLAVCIQHEVDHLNGILFVDYLSPLKRQRIRKKLEKLHRQQA